MRTLVHVMEARDLKHLTATSLQLQPDGAETSDGGQVSEPLPHHGAVILVALHVPRAGQCRQLSALTDISSWSGVSLPDSGLPLTAWDPGHDIPSPKEVTGARLKPRPELAHTTAASRQLGTARGEEAGCENLPVPGRGSTPAS
ncbi:hypothetical protein P7K49_040238 [Saguinus oedipus]|uniref:Uncharacterized protein n=1 Tax=Saguinus oedipus TaxID=9490 RepID=A0ABQ9T8P8_SAGOE|nr:hypothetical protein P7K49_040238 [Saguinus oedipus]